MEEVILRFPQIGETIFDLLDEKSLENCKNVCQTWKNFIEDPNLKLMWIQALKVHEKKAIMNGLPVKSYISGPKPRWSKLRMEDLKDFVIELEIVKTMSSEDMTVEIAKSLLG